MLCPYKSFEIINYVMFTQLYLCLCKPIRLIFKNCVTVECYFKFFYTLPVPERFIIAIISLYLTEEALNKLEL